MKLHFIFRKPAIGFFSIEKVFQTVIPFLSKTFQVNQTYVRKRGGSIAGLVDTFIFPIAKADIYHVTGDIHYAVLGLPRKRTVLTIHDCQFMQTDSALKREILKWVWLKFPIRNAGRITVISEKSKEELIRFTHCSEHKIKVIPNPVSPAFKTTPKEFNSECPRILHIGTAPNKNLHRVIKALKGIDCQLQIVGRLSAEDQVLLEGVGIRYSTCSNISEDALIKEYIRSDIVIFPSLYEGFGLPIIEAQAVGRIVITSDISPMKEVSGGGAMLVNPNDSNSIRTAVLEAIANSDQRRLLIERGAENVRKYSSEIIANQYQMLYEDLLSGIT